MLKKETNQRFLKLKLEQEEMAQATFKPALNPKSLQSSGTLRLRSEADTYIERVHSNAQMYSERQRQAVQEQEIKEIAECTFHPKVHGAPAYVTRIARSMALTKAVRQQEQEKLKPRPCWK